MESFNSPKFEYRPELDPSVVEYQPVDRLAELMRLLYKGERDLVATDLSGLEDDLYRLMRGMNCYFGLLAEAELSRELVHWGKNYEEQRKLLKDILGPRRVTSLENWGDDLLQSRGRANRSDKRTGVRGVVVGQVFLDFYRFSVSDRYPESANMDAEKLAERINARRKNWDEVEKGVKNPTPCSGEMMALILHYIRSDEMTDWKK